VNESSTNPASSATGQAAGNGPWRVLILDRDPEDPRWLLATVAITADVRPAVLDGVGQYTDWADVTTWVRRSLGRRVSLVPVAGVLAWHAYEGFPAIVTRQDPA
jgi:hypothetical protein